MKVKLLVALCLVVPSFNALAAPDYVRFAGSVQRDDAPATTFDLSVPAGKISRLSLPDGAALEFSAAASHGAPAQSVVRLFDASGKQVHSETAPGNAPGYRSVSYSICHGQIRFVSPAPLAPVACIRS